RPGVQARGEVAAGGRSPAALCQLAHVDDDLAGELAQAVGVVGQGVVHAAILGDRRRQSAARAALPSGTGCPSGPDSRGRIRKPMAAATKASAKLARLKNANGR